MEAGRPKSEVENAREVLIGFKFEKLIIWQKSMEFGESINKLCGNFPKEEMYNLSSQIRRAADSMALNISEDSIGQSNQSLESLWDIQYVPKLKL